MRKLLILGLAAVVLRAQDFELPERVAKLSDQASQKAGEGDDAAALSLLRAALLESESEFGENHPASAVMLVNLASLLRQQHKLTEARQAAGRGLALLEARFGHDDVILAPALNTLAGVLIQQGYYNAAHSLLARSMAIGPRSGVHYTTTLHNLGALYRSLGDEKQARRYYREAAEMRARLLGPDHPYTLLSENALGKRTARKSAGQALR